MPKFTRYCFIKNEPGLVEVKLEASTNMIVGAEFKLYKADTMEHFYTWKMASKDGKRESKILKTNPQELNKCTMVWHALICSLDPKVYEGKINIDIYLGQEKMKMNIPVEHTFDNIPPCKIKKSSSITSSLTFVLKETVK